MSDTSTPVVVTSSARRAALAATVGSTVEMYDFTIYGTAAALVFGQVFFPTSDPLVGTLLAFSTFAAGFFARVIGSAFIGHFGDRIGRKSMLIMTMVGIGSVTFCIGLLPAYSQIGIWAPILLVVLRIAQGFFFGGEHGGAMLIAVEHAPRRRRGYFGSFAMVGSPLGVALATTAFLGARAISGDEFLTWGWRLPFLGSLLIIVVGFVIRLGLTESPEFLAIRRSAELIRLPLVEAFRAHWRAIVLVAAAVLCATATTYLLIAFLLSYLTSVLGLPEGLGLAGTILGSAVMALAMVAAGRLSDHVGQRHVIVGAATLVAVYAFPFFWLLETREPLTVLLAMAVAYLFCGALWGPTAALFNSLFPAGLRYSGVSMGYQLGSVLGGGLAPLLATALLRQYGNASWPLALYMIGTAVILAAAIAAFRQRTPLTAETQPDPQPVQRTAI